MNRNATHNVEQLQLMVIGVQKGGTTSLSNYLAEHPAIRSPLCVEFTFFTDDAEYVNGADAYWNRFLPSDERADLKPIAKMSTLYHSLEGLSRLREHAPGCQLALVLRDPVARCYSAYRMACFDGWRSFDPGWLKRLLQEASPGDELHDLFIGYGHYAGYIERIWDLFPREQVHIFRFEDLQRDPQQVCDVLFTAMGIGPWTLQGKEKVHNETVMARSDKAARFIHWLREERNPVKRAIRRLMPYEVYLRIADGFIGMNRSQRQFPPLDPDVRAALAEHYRPHDERLAKLLGWDLSQWTSQRI
jgi:hypothetical protein